ncbi:MAG TPA: protein translocase subunit SecD [Bryobacteraceae bacterium]|nr:protein translocase subunit SecD [Bryobacteraceae bacterium]
MRKNVTGRTVFIVATILVCVFGIIGFPKSGAALKENLRNNIRLGLDLKGGSHLVLQVHVQDAVKTEADGAIERMKDEMHKQSIDYTSIDRNDPATVEDADKIQIDVKGVPPTKTTSFRSLLSEHFPQWVLSPVNATDYRLNMRPSELVTLKRDTVEHSLQTISNRINQLGLTEPTVQQYGQAGTDYEILVELPGVDDPARVREIMQTTAQLEIVAVKDERPYPTREAALAAKGGILPLNTKLVQQRAIGDRPPEWYLLSKTPVVRGTDLRNARAGQDDMRKWDTQFTLSPDAGKKFGRFTEANIGNYLAVVMDNQIYSVAVIKGRIEDSGQIENIGTEQEASDLALVLRAGALPATIQIQYENSVGPSLGADSIHAGIVAGLAGLAAVIAVMLVYYKRSGVNAVLALFLNTVILMAALSYFKAVLTLPGIAGVILTIGMAVDSNVLIFERIREELRAGKAIVSAVDAGFSKAWWTIVDTHVTTVVSCAFLFIFGEGPVRGFAVTLTIGLIANVFTAVFVSKVIFDYELSGGRQVAELSI